MVVPADLRPKLGRREIKKPLYVPDKKSAIKKARVSDIRLEQEILVFDVNNKAADKKLKNKFSKRLVPIHSHLLSLGILQYRDSLQKEGHTRLFPELNYSSMNGYGDDISDWFAEFRASVAIPKDGPVFHSFRHTVATAFLQASVAEAIAAKILGHSHKPITFGIYGKKPIEVLKDTIETLDFSEALTNVIPWGVTIATAQPPNL
jgi:integrase